MENLQLALKELPIWHGISQNKINVEKKPFHLVIDKGGLIHQKTDLGSELNVGTSYEDQDYNWITPPPGASEWANHLGDLYFNFFSEKVSKIIDGKNVLEIGAGSLYIAKKICSTFNLNSYTVIDPGIREKSGLDKIKIVKEYYAEGLQLEKKPDICISLNAFEHVLNPIEIIEKLYVDLSAKGEAILIFPNIEHQFKNGDFNALLHEHINYFTKESCYIMFENSGFDVVDCSDYEDTFYFHLRKKEKSKRRQNTELENTESLFRKSVSEFERNLDYFKKEVGQFLNANKKVLFHGATNGLNNLLGLCDFDKHENVEIIDGDEFKKNKYISSCKKAIQFSKNYDQIEFDVVFISAMTFYTPIYKSLIEDFKIPASKIRTIYPLG